MANEPLPEPLGPRRFLRVVSYPSDLPRSVLLARDFRSDSRLIIGDDEAAPNLLCGNCSTVLAEKVFLSGLLLECNYCGRFNDTDSV